MTASLVGSARIEITGDLSQFANSAESDIRSAFSSMQSTVDDGFTGIVESFGTAGGTAGTAFTDSAAGAITGDATTAAVTQGASDAETTAADKWAVVGGTAGSAFGDTATTAIADVGSGAVIQGADAATVTAADQWGQVGEAAGGAFTDTAASTVADGSDTVGAAIDQLASDASDATNTFGDAGQEAGNAFSEGIAGAVGPDSGAITAIPQAMDEGKPLAVAAATALGVESGEAGGAALAKEGTKAGLLFGGSLRKSLSALSGTIFAGLGIFGAASIIKGSIEAADASQAAAFKTKNVFGDSREIIIKWSETAVHALRETSDIAQLTADAYGQYLHGLGVGGDRAAEMAVKLTDLTANVAAFNNVSQSAVQSAFSGALKGRTGALKQYGVTIDKSVISAEALKHADELGHIEMKKGAPVLTTAQKGLAIYYALLDQTTNQQHAMADSSGTARAKQAELSAQVGELKTKIGNGLLPILTGITGFLISSVVPAFEAMGHWIVQNKEWLKPLVEVFVAFKLGMLAARISMGLFNSVLGISRGIALAYSGTMLAVAKVTDYFGLTQGAAAERQVAYDTRLAASKTRVATTEAELSGASSRTAGSLIREGEAAAVTSGEMGALAGTTQAAAAATTELDVASRAGGVGGLGRVGGAARTAEREVGALGGTAARTGGSLAGAATAAGGLGAASGEAGAAGALAFAPLLLGTLAVGAAVVGIGVAINHLTGDDAKWKKMKDLSKDLGNAKKAADDFGTAMADDGNKVGENTAAVAAAQLQAAGFSDVAHKAGLTLTDVTQAVLGSDEQFRGLIETMRATGSGSANEVVKLATLRDSFQKGAEKAQQLTGKQHELNDAVNAFKSPGKVVLGVTDGATKILEKARTDLKNLDGKSAFIYIKAITVSQGVTQIGGKDIHTPGSAFAAGSPDVPDGSFLAGEDGPEIFNKSGSHLEIVSNAKSMRALSDVAHSQSRGGGSNVGGLSPEDREFLVEALMNRPAVFHVNGVELARASNEGNMRLERR